MTAVAVDLGRASSHDTEVRSMDDERSQRLDEIRRKHESGDVEHRVAELRRRRAEPPGAFLALSSVAKLVMVVIVATAGAATAVGVAWHVFRWAAGW